MDRRVARAFFNGTFQAGIGEKQGAKLGDPDDEAEQHRSDERELNGAGGPIVVKDPVLGSHHCTLKEALALIGTLPLALAPA